MKSVQTLMAIALEVEDNILKKVHVEINAFDETDYVFSKEFTDFNEAIEAAVRILKTIRYDPNLATAEIEAAKKGGRRGEGH